MPTHRPLRVLDLCGQDLCLAEASHRMYWPGKPAAYVCPEHKARAEEIAHALGFELVVSPLRSARRSHS